MGHFWFCESIGIFWGENPAHTGFFPFLIVFLSIFNSVSVFYDASFQLTGNFPRRYTVKIERKTIKFAENRPRAGSSRHKKADRGWKFDVDEIMLNFVKITYIVWVLSFQQNFRKIISTWKYIFEQRKFYGGVVIYWKWFYWKG